MSDYLFTGPEWDLDLLDKAWAEIDRIAKEKFKLDYANPHMEIVTFEQMLDLMSSHAMPNMYTHWSFGKHFVREYEEYKKGRAGLAYEVVINTDPLIPYLMESNTMTMQALVMAHAVCGHGSFFKNNYLFKTWTDATSILTYLDYSRHFISQCEEKYGADEVDWVLDRAHALQYYGLDKYKRSRKRSVAKEIARATERFEYINQNADALFDELDSKKSTSLSAGISHTSIRNDLAMIDDTRSPKYILPEENLLYFIEKHSLALASWEREVIRIVRTIAQYFYPQIQTKLMNEGWASFIHYEIMTELERTGKITPGSYLEFLQSHTSVCCQRDTQVTQASSSIYSTINVYALGYQMFRDIKRMCIEPTEEDLKWFPDICNTDWIETTKHIVENYRDESFILQFLSPKVVRDMRLFTACDDEGNNYINVVNIHDDQSFIDLRRVLADKYNFASNMPQIEITGVFPKSRTLLLNLTEHNHRNLEAETGLLTQEYLWELWDGDIEWRRNGFMKSKIYHIEEE